MNIKDLIREIEGLKIENDELKNQVVIEYARLTQAEKILKKLESY